MIEVRLHGALWKSATASRSEEWRRSLTELNTLNALLVLGPQWASADDVALELVRPPTGEFVFRLYVDGWTCVATMPLPADAIGTAFSEYDTTIRQMVHVDKQAPVRGFEALDYAKRVVHDEAAAVIIAALDEVLETSLDDARRLFTLVFLVGTDLPESLVRYHRRHR
jgi:uncharacterized protein (UPF0262 family)